jgi:hypothetical protein
MTSVIVTPLVLFIFFWKFSPSVGYIERSYLIDVRGFSPATFGIILSAGGLTFLVSILAYRWVVHRFRGPALAGGGTWTLGGEATLCK